MKAHEPNLPTFFLTPKVRRKGLKRTKIRPVAKKRKAALKVYSELRKKFLKAHPLCQWSLLSHGLKESEVLSGIAVEEEHGNDWVYFWLGDGKGIQIPRATDIHHKNSRHNHHLTDISQWASVSRQGHQWIHAHPSQARKMGLLV